MARDLLAPAAAVEAAAVVVIVVVLLRLVYGDGFGE